jgi:gamma-glutamylcyclotransferase (GGCT)/AIG2-like uncharacterized protein YtfP
VNFFVYGTLRNGLLWGKPFGMKVGEATAPGVMYQIGWFPGVRFDQDGTVHGVVFENVSEGALQDLDRYESVSSGLFERVKIPVTLGDGFQLTCSAYQPRLDIVKSDRIIPSGDWTHRDDD